MEHSIKSGLTALPERLKQLKIDPRGYPIPWFVAEVEPGRFDFRVSDPKKWTLAIRDNLCWVCGGKMGGFKTFVIGPMCGINRVTAEPGCHLDCAKWSVQNCPFLSNPNMVRNEKNLEGENPGGIMLKRNPGVSLLWTTKKFTPFRAGQGYLLQLGEPTGLEFWAKGRLATADEIMLAIESGFPTLEEMARAESEERKDEKPMIELNHAKTRFLNLARGYL